MSAPLFPTLADFLSAPERPEGTLSYHEAQGFLFAVVCSPDPVLPSEWMPLVFAEGGPGYADLDEANAVTADLTALYNAINEQVLEHRCALPLDIEVRQPALANLDDDAPLSHWSRGFVEGHEWLGETWEDLPEEHDEELGATFMVLALFASRDDTTDFFASGEHGDLDAMAPELLNLLPQAMNSYAQMGRALGKALEEFGEPVPEPVRVDKVGRNDPCTCGSGKKFKKCCGA